MLVTLSSDILDQIEIEIVAIGEVDHQFVQAVFQLVIEGRPLPVRRGIAGFGRTIFETVALVGLGVGPAERASLEHRIKRVYRNEAARQLKSRRSAALAETADQVALGNHEADIQFRGSLRNHANVHFRRRNSIKNAGGDSRLPVNIFAHQANNRLLVITCDVGNFFQLREQCLWQPLAFHGERHADFGDGYDVNRH